jgi:hypothetical protein
MAHICKCFKSGNTLRISLLSGLRYMLTAQAGDYLQFEHKGRGVIEVKNLTEEQRIKARGKKK